MCYRFSGIVIIVSHLLYSLTLYLDVVTIGYVFVFAWLWESTFTGHFFYNKST